MNGQLLREEDDDDDDETDDSFEPEIIKVDSFQRDIFRLFGVCCS